METELASTWGSSTRGRYFDVCVWKLIWLLVSFFVLLMAIISIALLVMDMREPHFRVMSVSVSNFSVSDTQIKWKYEVGLTMTNPNKKIEVALDNINMMVFYEKVRLSVAQVHPIYLEKGANKSLKVGLVVRDLPRLEELVKDWNKGVVNFDMQMVARARFEAGFWPSEEKFLIVYCGDLGVGFYPKDTGRLLGVGKDCRV